MYKAEGLVSIYTGKGVRRNAYSLTNHVKNPLITWIHLLIVIPYSGSAKGVKLKPSNFFVLLGRIMIYSNAVTRYLSDFSECL